METTLIFPAHHDAISEKGNNNIRPFSVFNSSSERHTSLSAIVAMDRNNAIGFNGQIPWHLPEDLKHFKQTTLGHPVIMGRKTWESLPFKPLKERRNIVISRNPNLKIDGADRFASLEAAIDSCISEDMPFIIGGEQIYRQAFQYVSQLIVTEVDIVAENADAFFPEIDSNVWDIVSQSNWMESSKGLRYRFTTYRRI